MGLFKAIAKEIINNTIDNLQTQKNVYDKNSNWAASQRDERLKQEYERSKRNTSTYGRMKTKAIYDELKSRGY